MPYIKVDSEALNGAMTATANAIREKTGGIDKITWDEQNGFSDSVGDVYDAGHSNGVNSGKNQAYEEIDDLNDELEQTLYGTDTGGKSYYDDIWDGLQDYGKRTNYQHVFAYWGCEYIHPKYKVIPTHHNARNQTFAYNTSLKRIEKEYFDFSQCPKGTDASSGYYYTFFDCRSLEVIEDIGITNVSEFNYTFRGAEKLHTIECIYPDENTGFNNTFYHCYSLVFLRVNGTIGKNGFDVHYSALLDKESHISIVNALATTTSGLTVTLSKSAVNKAFETSAGANDGSTSAEWLALVATRSNWTIALA